MLMCGSQYCRVEHRICGVLSDSAELNQGIYETLYVFCAVLTDRDVRLYMPMSTCTCHSCMPASGRLPSGSELATSGILWNGYDGLELSDIAALGVGEQAATLHVPKQWV